MPSIRALEEGMQLHPKVTFLVGENGMGKSTLLEGIADKWGFSEESGNRAKTPGLTNYFTRLAPEMTLSREPGMRPMDGFFLRAESFFNFATEMDELEKEPFCGNGYFSYGGKSLHEQSHGESFFSLFLHRFDGHGLYLLDEPEATIYEFSEEGVREVSYRDSQPFEVTNRFLRDPEGMVKRLLED
ncbi:MAG: hypothetical protein QNL33_19175 [Akkermansiaceae bacterium]|jgi:predicted ATPase